MMGARVVFTLIIPFIGGTRAPEHMGHLLRHPELQPVEAHIHRLRGLGEDEVFDDPRRRCVVALDGVWGCLCPISSRIWRM